jgi:serine/threonine protein kinase
MIKNEHLIKLIDVFSDEKYQYVILEFCEDGNFGAYLKKKGRLTESEAQIYFN